MPASVDPTALKITCLSCGAVNRLPEARRSQGPRCGVCGGPLAGGTVAELDPARLEKAARTDGLPLLVDFWAPWCGPCRAMAPAFAEAAAALAGEARLARIDTQAHPEAAIRHAIRGIPALILFRNGRETARLAGARPAAEIVRFVRQHTG